MKSCGGRWNATRKSPEFVKKFTTIVKNVKKLRRIIQKCDRREFFNIKLLQQQIQNGYQRYLIVQNQPQRGLHHKFLLFSPAGAI
jgi:hypothetical protein